MSHFFSGQGKPHADNAGCMHCGGTVGEWETVFTNDAESLEGFEDWFCCYSCRDLGEPCDTFHKILPLETNSEPQTTAAK